MDDILAKLAHEEFGVFAQLAFRVLEPGTPYEHNWHLDCLAEHLQSNYSGEIPWLIINEPPRVLKSVYCAQLYPAWLQGREPHHQIICASYAHTLAERNVMNCRRVLNDDWYQSVFKDTRISQDQNQKDYYTTTANGQYKGTGIGGTITGFGCLAGESEVYTDQGIMRISNIRLGINASKALSYNHANDTLEWKEIEATRTIISSDIYEITTATRAIRCTGNHPIYVQGQGYIRADEIKPGQVLVKADALQQLSYQSPQGEAVTMVRRICSTGIPVYDLQIADNNNFFADGILVHNCETLIVDDPISPKEGASPTVRATAIEEVRSTLFSRFNDRRDGRFVMVMQRLHDADPTGELLKDPKYYHLKLPAQAKTQVVISLRNKTWQMQPGDILTPRLPEKELDELRIDMGEYNFAAQYQQSPVPLGGGEIRVEWKQTYIKAKPKTMNVYILVDAAGGDDVNKRKKRTSDFTAMMVIGLGEDNNYYLLDVIRDRLNPTERVETLFLLHRKWNTLCGKPPKVGYEKYGMMTDTHYIKIKQNEDNYRFPIIELGGQIMKEERIRRLIPDMQRGRWWYPATLPYADNEGRMFDLMKELDAEMAMFPRAKFDDMLDAQARIYEPDLQAIFPRVKEKVLYTPEETPQHWAAW